LPRKRTSPPEGRG